MRILLTCVLLGCSMLLSAQWTFVYENDSDGNRLAGDKSTLIEAVRSGKTVRIGWSFVYKKDPTLTIEHFAPADLVTILNGEDLFAQIYLTRSSTYKKGKELIQFGLNEKSYLFSTTDKQVSHDLEGELDRGNKLRVDVRLRWFVQ